VRTRLTVPSKSNRAARTRPRGTSSRTTSMAADSGSRAHVATILNRLLGVSPPPASVRPAGAYGQGFSFALADKETAARANSRLLV
jgi:hypothetical protein